MKIKRIATALILALIVIATISSVAFAESDVYATIESDNEVLRGEEIEFYISIGGIYFVKMLDCYRKVVYIHKYTIRKVC